MKTKEIIRLARDIRKNWQTNDPYVIAKKLGIIVMDGASNVKNFKAHTIKSENYPTFISINSAYTDLSKKVLCAHELGHAILHEDNVNYFAITAENVAKNVEFEANIFALALLVGDEQLNMPIDKLSPYMVKSILDFNIKLK
ncbi:protein of unknown function [Lachnospiraceae bacterium C7]|nr:protein of unknown function [Lachnospiraceae bacterium C7]